MWMQQTLSYFDIKLDTIPLKCDKKSIICLSKNYVLHYKSKNIDVRHQLLRDHVKKKNICLEYILTKDERVDIFTKPLEKLGFSKI